MLDRSLLEPLAEGAAVTVRVTLAAALLGTFMSVLSGLAGLSGWAAVRSLNRVYVDFFRGTSAIVQLFWIYYALPLVGPSFSAFEAAVLTLGLNMGAYGSEVVRGALHAVERGQFEASIALGLTPLQRMRHIIFPQAVVAMLPPFGNLLIELLKATALVSLITLPDLTFAAQILRNSGAASTTVIFSLALLLYFGLALGITALVRSGERFASRGLEGRAGR